MKGTTMEETTTDVPAEDGGSQQINGIPVDDQGLAVPEPEEAETTEAVETTTEDTEPETTAPAEPSEDDELASWADKKGLKLDSENATKAAKMAREAEKAMHSKAQKASELEKALDNGITQEVQAQGLTEDDRVDIARLKAKMTVRDFYDVNPEAKQHESAMIEELANKPYLAGDLESLYANALYKSGNLDAVKSQGKREALESLAHKQSAAVPTGNAVNSATMASTQITPENVDRLVGQNNVEWFVKNQAAINKAMAG